MPIAIYALALAAFAIGTAEFVVSGILPPLATDLAIGLPTAGLLVTAYAIGVAIGGPILSVLVARFPPRPVIIGVLATFAASQVFCALAPDYGLLLVARVASSVAHGAFFAVGVVVISRLVPFERRGGAFSLFIGGITIANLLGLPGGAAIGVAFGWRATFLAVGALGLIAMLAIIWRLPSLPPGDRATTTLASQFRELRHQQVYLSYLVIVICMIGLLAFGTYQVAMLTQITRIEPSIVPLYLLLGGVGAMLGVYLSGRATDWRPMHWLVGVMITQAVLFFGLAAFGLYDKVLVGFYIFAIGAVGFAFATPLQARIMHAARAAPNLAAALISSAFNVGIALGALIGGMLLDAGVHIADLPALGTVTGLLAAGVIGLSWWLDGRGATPQPVGA